LCITAFVRIQAWQLEVVEERVFPAALAFGAGQLYALFDNITFSVAGNTNHFYTPYRYSMKAAAKRLAFGGP
jgi:hypothetical protein